MQLIEKKKTLGADSLKFMAEQLEGSFTITVMDEDNNIHFVKGDNPICIYHFEDLGIYIYALRKTNTPPTDTEEENDEHQPPVIRI